MALRAGTSRSDTGATAPGADAPALTSDMVGKTTANGFRGEFSFLSSFHPCPVAYLGLQFTCSEGAYQAAKSLDPEVQKLFVRLTGAQAKAKGRGKPREGWHDIKLGVMREVLESKYANLDLRERLLATEDIVLVEVNTWNDLFWGVCRGKGENNLGKLHMEFRERFRQGWVPPAAPEPAEDPEPPLGPSLRRAVKATSDASASLPDYSNLGDAWLRGATFPNRFEIAKHGGEFKKPEKAWLIKAWQVPDATEFLSRAEALGLQISWVLPEPPSAVLPEGEARATAQAKPLLTPEQREKVILLVTKLRALGASGDGPEAALARSRADRLMQESGLTEAALRLDSEGHIRPEYSANPFAGIFDDLMRQWQGGGGHAG